jgi:hypothetical protein
MGGDESIITGDRRTSSSTIASAQRRGLTVLHRCKKILPIFIAAHSGNQVQRLDLCLFGAIKNNIENVDAMSEINIQTLHIVQVVTSYMSLAAPIDITASFRNGGVPLDIEPGGRLTCRVTRETPRCPLEDFEAEQRKEVEEEEFDASEREEVDDDIPGDTGSEMDRDAEEDVP